MESVHRLVLESGDELVERAWDRENRSLSFAHGRACFRSRAADSIVKALVHRLDVFEVNRRGSLGRQARLDRILDREEDELVGKWRMRRARRGEDIVHLAVPGGDPSRLGVAQVPDPASDHCEGRLATRCGTERAFEELSRFRRVEKRIPVERERDASCRDRAVRVLLGDRLDLLVDVFDGSI